VVDGDCKPFEDGDPCNGTLQCDKKQNHCTVAEKSVVVCPTAGNTACSHNLCDPKDGACKPTPVCQWKHCDADGNTCTLNDLCEGGTCKAGANLCPCQLDGQCGDKDDGDLCNGTLYCEKSGPQGFCQVNPGTVVMCGKDGATPCALPGCEPRLGKCKLLPKDEGAPCDDGSACTKGDQCQAGLCIGVTGTCDDGDACTKDLCLQAKGVCAHDQLDCDDDKPCTTDSCAAAKGCVHSDNSEACDDGDVCTVGDQCGSTLCLPGAAKSCNDGVPCTVDACDAKKGCTATVDLSQCDDGNPCTDDQCDVQQKACKAVPLADATVCGGERACHAGQCVWATAVTAGGRFSCVLLASRKVACWGLANKGQLGINEQGDEAPQTPRAYAEPKSVLGLENVVSLASFGGSYRSGTCAVTADGKVWCWGLNDSFNVGINENPIVVPKVVPGASPAVAVSRGDRHQCTVRKDGLGECWGLATYGTTMSGTASGTTPPGKAIAAAIKPVRFAGGGSHMCAATTNQVWCAGWNTFAQMGNGKTTPAETPTAVKVGLPDLAVNGLSSGDRHLCAVLADKKVWCWGSDDEGRGGDGVYGDSNTVLVNPVKVVGVDGALDVGLGAYHSCAVTEAGAVYCWGRNSDGQVGSNGTVIAPLARKVPGLPPSKQVAGGFNHSCAVNAVGEVRCFGNNEAGQLGNGQFSEGLKQPSPQLVTGSAAPAGEACKLPGACDDGDPCTQDLCNASDGKCSHPASADGTACATGKVCVSGGCKTPWAVALAVGDSHTCALHPNGTVRCWGDNYYGQCGVGYFGDGGGESNPLLPPCLRSRVWTTPCKSRLVNGTPVRCGRPARSRAGATTTTAGSATATATAATANTRTRWCRCNRRRRSQACSRRSTSLAGSTTQAARSAGAATITGSSVTAAPTPPLATRRCRKQSRLRAWPGPPQHTGTRAMWSKAARCCAPASTAARSAREWHRRARSRSWRRSRSWASATRRRWRWASTTRAHCGKRATSPAGAAPSRARWASATPATWRKRASRCRSSTA
jgi:alpha-tubulin suppressor-like RCC1 family protein